MECTSQVYKSELPETNLSQREERLFTKWCIKFGVDWRILDARQRQDYIELWKDNPHWYLENSGES